MMVQQKSYAHIFSCLKGFDQFRADPDFCSLILDAAEEFQNVNEAAGKHMKSVGGLFVHGLLNSELLFFEILNL